jgi:catechol 2,3-dioxygenase-like lactoylglutathione lyase family enzyme
MKLLTLLAAFTATVASAQLAPQNNRGVTMGHLHLNVSDIASAKHFWIDVLGATPMKLGDLEGVEMPGAIVFFKQAAPTGPTIGSAVNHLGFSIQTLAPYAARLQAAGVSFEASKNGQQLMIAGPEGLRIELTADPALRVPTAHHHVHYYTAHVPEMQAWYAKTYGAIPGKRGTFVAADIPGANLSFSPVETIPLPTKGRALDHVGFEVKNLEAFCKKLGESGVTFDVPYRKIPALGISVAFFTDPWGVYTELTEGLK